MRTLTICIALLLLSLPTVVRAQDAEPTKAMRLAHLLGTGIADAVEVALPSVVVVHVQSSSQRTIVNAKGELEIVEAPASGQGSGAFISAQGHVITSAHVVNLVQVKVEVETMDGQRYPAEIVGVDGMTDLAVIKVAAPEDATFPAIQQLDSDTLRVGELVIALGAPHGLKKSASWGIISQVGRSVGQFDYESFIQTDAAINPGNSGGPLINVFGQWAGVNAMIKTSGYSTGNIGIGFVIPSNLAMQVAKKLIQHGTMVKAYIGFAAEEIDVEEETLPSGIEGAVRVHRVLPGSPAEKGGLRQGDLVLSAQDKPTCNVFEIKKIMHPHLPGDTISFKVLREGQVITIEVTVEQAPKN